MTKSKKDKGTGYKNPPKETQWKKGQSGNPKGRPKKSDKNPDEDKNFWKVFEEEMRELITVNTPEGPQKISTKRALIKRLIEKAIKDKDSRSMTKIIQIFEKLNDIEDANEDYEPVISGGSLERPALSRLLDDIKAGKINVIVVYKIDRLTRSLTDFSKLVEVFDEYGVTFVSITQSFNTTTSMGRLTLNVLLSFAQFEREVSGERIRDKIAASKAKGMWMGGRAPLGFDIENRRLIINEEDAPQAKKVFELYLKLGCVKKVRVELKRLEIKSRERISQKGRKYGGEYFSRGALYGLLQNPAYIGKISHKDEIHEGLHDAIIPTELWDAVQKKLSDQASIPRGHQMQRHKNLLTGLMFDDANNLYSPVFTNKKNKKYRYYFNQTLADEPDHPNKLIARLPAHEIETLVEKAIREQTRKLCGEEHETIIAHVLKHQHEIPIYDLVQKCVERLTIQFGQLAIRLKPGSFTKLADQYLGVNVTGCSEQFEITVPYQTRRVQNGAIILKPEEKTDIFDLSSKDLKKLVQGIIWRDEHFDGMAIKAIARREKCSHDYVSSAIFKSFKTLQNAV